MNMSELFNQESACSPKFEPTFHLFPRLPLELRIQVWESAVFDRLMMINGNVARGYWSPTPVPPVTRACCEARKYSSYRKHFTVSRKHTERYFWMNPVCDIIQIRPILIRFLRMESQKVTRLRIDLSYNKLWIAEEFYWQHGSDLETFPDLENASFPDLRSVDTLVAGELALWTNSFDDSWWDASSGPHVRIVSRKTGEWMDEANCGVYWDWLDNSGKKESELYIFTRKVLEDVESCEERAKKVDEFKRLPRTMLAYW